MRAAIALAAALLAAPAAASPCDAIDDPLAFNACLARQGPAARAVLLHPAPGRKAGGRLVLRPHGRTEMVFSPGK